MIADIVLHAFRVGIRDSFVDAKRPQESSNAPRWLALHRDGHRAMAALSNDGVDRLVAGADHVIQASNPQIVIAAIRHIMACARRTGSLVRPSAAKCLKNS